MYQQEDLIDADAATPDTEDQSTLDGAEAAVRLLEIATRSADELVDEATAEAASLVASAQADADQLAAASKAKAERLTASARAEADQLLAAARAEAERVQAVSEHKRTTQAAEISRLEELEQSHKEHLRSHLSELMAQIEPTSAD
jgi:cell division septum initiation protein DivIVA